MGIWALLAVLLLTAAGAVGYLKKTYTVETVYVEGNVHYTEEEIKELVMSGPFGDNSLYLSLKYKNKGIEGIPFVDVVDVDILSPDTVKIIVYEKTLTGCVRYLDTYIYFDRDGYVVESSGIKTSGVPQIMGLQFDHMITGEKLPVGNEEIFDSILSITQLLQKYKLISDKIYFNRSGAVTLYFEQVKVSLGSDSATLEDKLMLLSQLLPSLEGKRGTLQMQTYDANSGKYVFKPEA
ncbi:MAG: FtsQ-type POTRA domain-containing protein [Lachnospiraceae bacterium]|nr:FtsQ-type POTRA domain-containing protein [Lachnospiraceae bacterium]